MQKQTDFHEFQLYSVFQHTSQIKKKIQHIQSISRQSFYSLQSSLLPIKNDHSKNKS